MLGSDNAATQMLGRLAMVRIAKDVYLSRWYEESASAFSEAAQRVFRQISEESRAERDDALAVMEEWARRERAGAERAARVIQAMAARDFIDDMIEMKQASADVFQKAAMIAPDDLREKLLRLALIDLRHAMWLRDTMLKEFPDPSALLLPNAR